MTAAVVNVGLPALVAQRKALGAKFKAALRVGLQAGAMRALAIIQDAARAAPPANPQGVGSGGAVDTGRYLRSWKVRVLQKELAVRVFNDAPYAPVIEYGRRPGARMPPRGPIQRWAKRRLGLSPREARDAAWAIAAAIAQRGLVGRLVLQRAQATIAAAIRAELLQAVQDALAGGPGAPGGGP